MTALIIYNKCRQDLKGRGKRKTGPDVWTEMSRKRMIVIAAAALTVLLSWAVQQPKEPQDVWKPFQFFVGQWEGTGEGKPGVSRGKQEFSFVLGGQYMQVRNESRFDPQETSPTW